MDTGRLKHFAAEARNILMRGVAQRVSALGFDNEGNATESPILMDGGCVFMGEIMSLDFHKKWKSLQENIIERGAKQVVEEAAYTWFNRFMAIRIMARNEIISPILEFESQAIHIPVIVAEARKGRMPEMDAASKTKLNALLESDALTAEQFALLIVAFCHANPIINSCFGNITDYTELLLPTNILSDGGFIDMLNSTPFIEEQDYRSPELIGWLYQFYISERKDEVFAKKGKFEADEIPAATQIFTPNWIVKYMVQNTVGRIYLDNNPYSADDFKPKWKYLVEPSQPTPEEAKYTFNDLKELKVADLACGSGHILNECFDLLYDLYIYDGYSRKDAVENILGKNLSGIDLDTRAKQLAQFALLLKACQKDLAFADAHCMPRILDMPNVDRYTWMDLQGHMCCNLKIEIPTPEVAEEIQDCFKLMEKADSLGSIMKFNISDETREFIKDCIWKQSEKHMYEEQFKTLFHGFELILMLTEQYSALVMNPPYMKYGNMNESLSEYVREHYVEGRFDLFSAFMMLAIHRLVKSGKYGMINMQSWMFLTTFEQLRFKIIEEQQIDSLLHLGPNTFDELTGEVVQNVAFTISKNYPLSKGTYFNLCKGDNCNAKELLFSESLINHSPKVFFSKVDQKAFSKIIGCPIGYNLSDKMVFHFTSDLSLSDKADLRSGISTGDNDRFYRFWAEVSSKKMSPNYKSTPFNSNYKWFKMIRGGSFRKWYGCCDNVLNLENSCYEIENSGLNHRLRTPAYYTKFGITWNRIASGNLGFRVKPKDFNFGENSPCMFIDGTEVDVLSLLALLNTKCVNAILQSLNPTLSNQLADLLKIPVCDFKEINDLVSTVDTNINISKADWDAHETSWDFQRNELLTMDVDTLMEHIDYYCDKVYRETGEQLCIDPAAPEPDSIEWCYNMYCDKWTDKFDELHRNEEELNRQFIEIYGLQDELTPDVPLNEITILQQGEISIENGELKWHPDVVMKQLISYAIGCMMGRYSLDKPGLILANQGDGLKQFEELVPNSTFEIDDDGIIPLMPESTWFTDNATVRFKKWLAVAFGEDMVNKNLNFIEECMNRKVDDYLVKDFWKDHKKMYQNRPIYWLFSSEKGAFQCLAYMHRMDAFTPERVRTKYLLPHLEWLHQQYNDMESRLASLSTKERKQMDNIAKQIKECQEYHDILHVVADDHDNLAFDLDDGVLANYAKFEKVLAILK